MTSGLYDIHIECRNLHYLCEEDENINLHNLTVKDIMTSTHIKVVEEIVNVGDLLEILRNTSHQCYPVVQYIHTNAIVCGTITRNVLCSLIKHKIFTNTNNSNNSCNILLKWDTLESVYPRYPKLQHLSVTIEECKLFIDVRPYLNIGAYIMNENATAQRAYRMFRTLGLRHLCIVDKHNFLRGMLTRANFIHTHVTSSKIKSTYQQQCKQLYSYGSTTNGYNHSFDRVQTKPFFEYDHT